MSAASVLSNLVPLPTQSAAEENLENKLETLETDSSSSSGFALNNSEVGFQFNALPIELKNMVWNEISFVEGDSGNPRSEQEYRIRYSKVNLEWHEIKGKATKYDVGPRMDVIALSEILKENSKGSTAREFYIGHDVVTDEEAQAFASIFRSCNKLNILSIYAARQDDSYVRVNRIYELELSFALARLGDLRQLSIRGHYWDRVCSGNPYICCFLTKLTDLRVGCALILPPNSGLAPLTTLHVESLYDQEVADSLSISYAGSYNTLKNLGLSFYDSLESYDSLNEFIASFINLETFYLTSGHVPFLRDSTFLIKALPKLQKLQYLYLESSVQPASVEFLYKLPNLKTLSYQVYSSLDHLTLLLINSLETDQRGLEIEDIVVAFDSGDIDDDDLRFIENESGAVADLLKKLKVVAESKGIKVMTSESSDVIL